MLWVLAPPQPYTSVVWGSVFRLTLVRCYGYVLGCEHKSVEHFPTRRNYYVCNRFFVFFLQQLGQSTLNFGEGKKSVELSPSG